MCSCMVRRCWRTCKCMQVVSRAATQHVHPLHGQWRHASHHAFSRGLSRSAHRDGIAAAAIPPVATCLFCVHTSTPAESVVASLAFATPGNFMCEVRGMAVLARPMMHGQCKRRSPDAAPYGIPGLRPTPVCTPPNTRQSIVVLLRPCGKSQPPNAPPPPPPLRYAM